MPRPFITFAPHRKLEADWLAECLKNAGFEAAVFTVPEDSKDARRKVSDAIQRTDCCIALLSPAGKDDPPGTPMAPWITRDVTLAVDRDIRVALIREKGTPEPGRGISDDAIASEEVDLDDPPQVISFVPKLFHIVHSIRTILEKAGAPGQKQGPMYLDKVHCINEWTPARWRHLRTITLTALKPIPSINHGIDTGMDKTPGLSVKLAQPDVDLKVTCLTDPHRIINVELLENEPHNVEYRIDFGPPLKASETISYRHESIHPLIVPLTHEDLKKRLKQPGVPGYMKDGYIGEGFDVTKPTGELVLEVDVPREVGLTAPRVMVCQVSSLTEVEDESERIGNPETKPKLWRVNDDLARGRWNCQVTIPQPGSFSYYLLVKPTK